MLPALLFAASLLPPEQPCDTAARVAEVHAVQQRLFAMATPQDDMPPEDTPAEAQHDVPALRAALSAAVTSFLQCDSGAVKDAAVLQGRLAEVLGAEQAEPPLAAGAELQYVQGPGDNRVRHLYGDFLEVGVQRMPGASDMLAVDLSFGIACGDDHILLVFQHSPEGWRRTLEWKGDKFADPSDAFGDFFSYAAVPGPGGEPLLLAAHGMPGCSSRMSGLKVDLLQPGPAQKTLAHEWRGYSRFEHEPGFALRADGATLFADVDGNDLDRRMTFPARLHYRTTAGKLERLPEAGSPLDFVDQWLGESWAMAATWSAQPNAALQEVHDSLGNGFQAVQVEQETEPTPPEAEEANANATAPEANSDYQDLTFGEVRACRLPKGAPALPRLFQVEVNLDGQKDGKDVSAEMFFLVEQTGTMYRLRSAGGEALRTCDGKNLNPHE